MALNTPTFGEGTVLKVNDGASNAFVELDDYIALTPPGEKYAKVARKVLRKNRVLNVISPVADFGDLLLTYEINVTSQARYDALKTRVRVWQIIYMDGLQLSFTGTLYDHTPGQIQDGNAINTAAAMIAVQSLVAASTVTAPTLPVVAAPALT